MAQGSEEITIRVPREAAEGIPTLSAELSERMHALLERNTDGHLSSIERAELETLVRMSQFADLFSMILRGAKRH